MAAGSTFKSIGAWTAAIAIALTVSYCSERPKYEFERSTVAAVKENLPGARIISSIQTIDFFSPVSWFWPTTERLNFAMPDTETGGTFYQFTVSYDNEPASVFLIQAFCQERELRWYDLDEPESAFPARDWLGRVVTAPNGKTYRLHESKYPNPPEWLHAFCDTDWTVERSAERAAQAH
jgi:hypothetical protein